MEVSKVESSSIESGIKLVLWVNCFDEGGYRDRPYVFKWDQHAQKVFFMFGGMMGEPRPVGTAQTAEQAQEMAIPYLEKWLTHCGAL